MPKSIRVIPKKRGRPATGKDPLYGVRIPDALMASIKRWAKANGSPSRSDGMRRLLEIGLKAERALVAEPSALRARSKGAPKAAEMAGHEINMLGDKSATDEERATRKRRLISGPKEFRGMRRKWVRLPNSAPGHRRRDRAKPRDYREAARAASIEAVCNALVAAGITFLPDDGKAGVGVRGKSKAK
jgi:hypothetical protein